ncbi:MAG: radical SAM family heme chaperone HemW [Eubacteriales bacterium]|nr:radical SAM family heme chaperone HemW [Eubacteriales bacterium]
MKKPLELYLHIPFCVQKCAYCDFLSAPAGEEVQEQYVRRLLCEIRQAAGLAQEYEAVTAFFGGGTPSILKAEHIRRIMETLGEVFSWRDGAEVTIEANPGTVDRDKLRVYRECGVNRLSFGLQSADNEELLRLGRIHTWEQFLESFRMAREAGFSNLNVDLMSALPGQTEDGWRRTLERTAALEPEHISAYSLIIEEGTPFYGRYAEHPELLPDEDTERSMYDMTKKFLRERGYERYEISNYAKPGYACRHNLGYWERTDYKGFGLGAASLLGGVRSTNQTELSEYLKGNFAGTSGRLSEQDVREEYFFLGLRKTDGVDPGPYRQHYGALLEKLKAQGLLTEKDGSVCLTDYGIDISNYVLAQFLDD